jgi:tetratricopeptide (TPR) repeat protein
LTTLIALVLIVPALRLQAGPLQEGLALFDLRGDLQKAYEAVHLWEEALSQAGPEEKYDLCWRISAAYHFIATHEDRTDKDRIVELLDKGHKAGQKALELNPNGVDALYWGATNLAEMGQVQGILKSLFLVKPLKADMDRIIELDPEYYKAYLLLGILYLKAPPWPLSIGNSKKGIETLQYAIRLNPKCLRCYLELSRAYLKQKDIQKARAAAQDLLRAGIEPDYEVETPEYRQQAREILLTIGDTTASQ